MSHVVISCAREGIDVAVVVRARLEEGGVWLGMRNIEASRSCWRRYEF
jgi:hypothetical protein